MSADATTRRDSATTVLVPIAPKEQGPDVEVLRDGEVVTLIRVTCSCGASVDIACDYSEVAK